jgi:hypothetical protein
MTIAQGIKAVVDLVEATESKAALVRFVVDDDDFIATVEVYDGESEEMKALSSRVHDLQAEVAAMKLSEDDRDVVDELMGLATNILERGEILDEEGHGSDPESAVADLFTKLQQQYKELLVSAVKTLN